MDRRSYGGVYEIVDGLPRHVLCAAVAHTCHPLPRNPLGRTGFGGRGVLARWGPNHASDPVISRCGSVSHCWRV